MLFKQMNESGDCPPTQNLWVSDSRPRFCRADWIFLLLVVVLTMLTVQWMLNSKTTYNKNYLIRDEGVGFLVTDVLLHGGTLYKDIAYPYGYIPAYLQTTAAWLLGNTISTYLHIFLVLDVVVLGMIYMLLRKMLCPSISFAFTLMVILPNIIAPGAIWGNGTSNLAYPLEKIPLLCIALLWRKPQRQPRWRALLIGCCLGGLQGIKFGTAFVAGAALLLVTLLFWYQSGFSANVRRIELRNHLCILGGFVLVQSVWIAVTVFSLPLTLATDVLWPTYMYAHYGSFAAQRYPEWRGLGYFVSGQMVPLLGTVGSLWWLATTVFARPTSASAISARSPVLVGTGRESGGMLMLLIFYLLGACILFRGVWHFLYFVWIPLLGGTYFFLQPSRIVRWAVVVISCVGFARFLQWARYAHSALPLEAVTLDNGEQLWVSDVYRRDVDALIGGLRTASSSSNGKEKRIVVFYPLGAGYHVFFHLAQQGRNSWYAPGLVRPYDVAQIKELARSARWVILLAKPAKQLNSDPYEWDKAIEWRHPTLDAESREELKFRLKKEREIDNVFWIFSQSP